MFTPQVPKQSLQDHLFAPCDFSFTHNIYRHLVTPGGINCMPLSSTLEEACNLVTIMWCWSTKMSGLKSTTTRWISFLNSSESRTLSNVTKVDYWFTFWLQISLHFFVLFSVNCYILNVLFSMQLFHFSIVWYNSEVPCGRCAVAAIQNIQYILLGVKSDRAGGEKIHAIYAVLWISKWIQINNW